MKPPLPRARKGGLRAEPRRDETRRGGRSAAARAEAAVTGLPRAAGSARPATDFAAQIGVDEGGRGKVAEVKLLCADQTEAPKC